MSRRTRNAPGLSPALFLEVTALDLSARALNGLASLRLRWVGELVQWTQSDLLRVKSLGRVSVAEVMAQLSLLDLSLGMTISGWEAVDAEEVARARSSEIALARSRCWRGRARLDSTRGVEAEVASAIAVLVPEGKPRRRRVVESWLGLAEKELPTLQEVGDRFGLTRERVRQIVDRTGDKAARAQLELPRLRAALAWLDGAGALSAAAAAEGLVAAGHAKDRLSVAGLLRTAELLAVTVNERLKAAAATGFVGLSADLAVQERVVSEACRAVRRRGCATLAEIAASVSAKIGIEVPPALVGELLGARRDYRPLDEEGGWFSLAGETRNRLLLRIEKLLAVAGRALLGALAVGIRRDHRMEGFCPPLPILAAICKQMADCEVSPNGLVTARKPWSEETMLGDGERLLVEIFRKHGPVMRYGEVSARFRAAGGGKAGVGSLLLYSPVIVRPARGLYSLAGTTVSPHRLAELRDSDTRSRSPLYRDCGTADGGATVWVVYRLTKSALQQGSLMVPVALRSLLGAGDSYDLVDDGDDVIGRLRIGGKRMNGLGAALRSAGVKAGDRACLTMLVSEKMARVERMPGSTR